MFSYKTKVKIDMPTLGEVTSQLEKAYNAIGHRETHEGRSKFSQWNNVNKFYQRLSDKAFFENSAVLEVVGESKGNTARVYYKPSVTSYTKPFRKSIVPLNPNNEFLFFDLKAAEFFMNAVFSQEIEAVNAYHAGEDIYMHYASIFPKDTPRDVIKTCLIANMYNSTAYSTAIRLGISETQAQRLLDMVAYNLPKITSHKRDVIMRARQCRGYYAPKGFDQSNLVKIADVNPAKGFSEEFALNAYVQSALGFFMQNILALVLAEKPVGTVLSVFDSLLIEIEPETKGKWIDTMTTWIAPFRADKFSTGKTFFEAAYGLK